MSDINLKEQKALEFNKALFNVKQELKAVAKTSNNPFFKSKYADLNAHLDAVEPILAKYDLFLLQPTKTNGQFNVVESIITHINGENIAASFKVPELDDPQKLGGAVTYLRRYTLSALLGLKAEDDDGNLASGKVAKKKTSKKSNYSNDF